MSREIPGTVRSIAETINRFTTVRTKTMVVIKRSYDDWFFKQFFYNFRLRGLAKAQRLNLDTHRLLGSDLAAAKFVLGPANGKVRDGRGRWYNRTKDLPPDYTKSFKVTAIDLAKKNIVLEGIDNLVGLEHLEYLNLSNNKYLDDFCCDQLSRQFRKSTTLKEIDLSSNPAISIYGLEILFRIPSLRRITAVDTLASKDPEIDLFTLSAEDERNCDVRVHENGRKYNPEVADELESIDLSAEDGPIRVQHTPT